MSTYSVNRPSGFRIGSWKGAYLVPLGGIVYSDLSLTKEQVDLAESTIDGMRVLSELRHSVMTRQGIRSLSTASRYPMPFSISA